MSQSTKPKQGKRTPSYSANSIVAYLIIGLVFIALGLLLFISAVTRLEGDIFRLLRHFAGGMAGTLGFLLPVIPVWGGVLLIMSTQRKPPLRPFLLSCLLVVLLCTTVTLMTQYKGGPSLMDSIRSGVAADGISSDSYPAFLADAYEYGSGSRRNDSRSIGGGLLGMLLAWPLWKGVGNIFGMILTILGAIASFLFLIRLDFRAIAARIRSGSQQFAAQQEQKRVQREQEAYAKQQAALAEQQRQQALYAQQQAMQPMPQATPRPAPAPAEAPDPWQSMMPAGASGWNSTHGRPQPVQQPVQQPMRQPMQTQPQHRQPPVQTPYGFQPEPETSFAAPEPMPQGDMQGLFRRSAARSAEEKPPRRRGFLARTQEDDGLVPGEASCPAERPSGRSAATATAPVTPVAPQEPAPAAYDTPQAAMNAAEEDYAPVIAQPVEEETPAPRRTGRSKPAEAPAPAAEPAPAPTPEKAVRKGSFADRLQSAMAGKAAATAPAEAAPAARSSHKDTPSAWSQPEGELPTATWRDPGDAPAPTRPAARRTQAAAAPQPTENRKQVAPPSWSETPPWEDAPVQATPEAAVMPVLTREPPAGAYKPDLVIPPSRSGVAAPNGDVMVSAVERPYVFPSMELLAQPKPQAGISPEEDEIRSRRLENTLQSFKVPAKVRHITHGPAISRFELDLAPGVRVSKVTDLNRNIAMNLEVKSVRIEAPIPGKSLVGVEVPNQERATVTLREVLMSDAMMKATKPLVVALGKDIAGTPIVCDLAKMPHLLIAGATGSGKSVCINTIINSLLYRCSPKEVRLILVDPKVVELQCYNGIPHLLVPVVSDPHKASGALAWAVGEMMDRYRRFQEAGVRAIDGYNDNLPEGEEKMPRIVIVIDELADLMMTCKKDVEERICRLAQLARAAGIHLIVATQRPSVDVITGLIKANIPSRIAFKVSSNVDSRTILDRIGAEQLLGYGDMLYMPTGEFTPIRVQGCFLSDDEVNRITDFIRDTCPASYDAAILEQLDKLQTEGEEVVLPDASADDDYTGGDGSLLMQAIEMAVNDGQVSTSLIQRRLRLGYARAGRLVDEMEKRGIISQKDGAKPRMCLISREEFEVMKDSGVLD